MRAILHHPFSIPLFYEYNDEVTGRKGKKQSQNGILMQKYA
jgi:hypothetical protein